jgi:hypothetical protein
VDASPAVASPTWIPPARPAHQRKKKAALTPKEALRAKVQARAVKPAGKAAMPSREPGPALETTAGETEEAAAAPRTTTKARAEPHPPPPRAVVKARRAPPSPPVEEDEPAPPPAKPGFFERVLGVFRKRKQAPPSEDETDK